ncbi:DoxX family membrane protein [Niabella sp. 22666]|uniref:DoxX family membrane protein n=1 Tax=Niabella sp. 22666 TaxID=3453954 RepID=UPI003F872BB0
MLQKTSYTNWAQLIFRIAISLTLFSAVADRFGYWGAQSAWGNWANFEAYTGQLLFFLPHALVAAAAVVATILEIAFGVLLLIGYKTRPVAILTGCLLLLFATSMVMALGLKPTLDYSVWVGAAGCFLLAGIPHYSFSIDQLNNKQWKKD